jgi:hypothetical protein
MERLFANGWITMAMMFLVAIADLIALTSRIHLGAGFILAFIFFVANAIYKSKPENYGIDE